jgi:hypothetical protein
MARRQAADEHEGFQIWRVAANILNKQSQTADKMWSFSFGLGLNVTNPHRKNKLVTKCHKGPEYWIASLFKPLRKPSLKWIVNVKIDLREI